MKVTEILKIHTDFNNCLFNVVKKRVHNYLEVNLDKTAFGDEK